MLKFTWYFYKNSKISFFIFVRINFYEETYITYLARIKFGKLRKKDILPAAVTFFKRLLKGVYKACQIINLCYCNI